MADRAVHDRAICVFTMGGVRNLAAHRDERTLRKAFPQLSAAQTRACLLYYAKFPDDITAEIAANAALTQDALESRSPGLVRTA